MCLQNIIDGKNIKIQPIDAEWLPKNTFLDVLRLDLLHPVVSGNKWFKLKYCLEEAKQQGHKGILTFGGAWSNHIVAAAFASQQYGFESVGVIRGEKPVNLSDTLLQATAYGMQLRFVTRTDYKKKESIALPGDEKLYLINEGGFGALGAKGAAEILQCVPDAIKFTHIVCAVGTGTMFAGLVNAAKPHQTVIGISVLKNNFSVDDGIMRLVNKNTNHGQYSVLHTYHFGGYAKHPPALIQFMNEVWQQHGLPTDIVYTSKAFFALQQMVINTLIAEGSRVLFIHSGGLQGNASLPTNVLLF